MIGQIIADRYEILDLLGQGGMGTVYRARHVYTKKDIALKVLHPDLKNDEQFVRRFLTEVELASRVVHPNAVVIHDAGRSENGMLYLAMEYLRGTVLSKTIAQYANGMSFDAVLSIARQIGEALEAIHACGLIHRDLKPDNIVLLGEGALTARHVKVLDFGIAKALEGTQLTTRTGMIIGTPEYMSPEQAKGTKLDSRSDIYSFGLIIYEMLAGRTPFESDTPVGYLTQHVLERPPRLKCYRGNVPEEAERAVMQALAKEKADRFESARDFIITLENGIDQKSHSVSAKEVVHTVKPTEIVNGELIIKSVARCQLRIDDRDMGVINAGNLYRYKLTAGKHEIQAKRKRGRQWKREVIIRAGEKEGLLVKPPTRKYLRVFFLIWLVVFLTWWYLPRLPGWNTLPRAWEDEVSTTMDTAVTIDVLANDNDADGDDLQITDVGNSLGSVVNTGDGFLTYTPATGFIGEDVFRYTIVDGRGGTSSAAVVVAVLRTNAEPAADDGDSVPAAGVSGEVEERQDEAVSRQMTTNSQTPYVTVDFDALDTTSQQVFSPELDVYLARYGITIRDTNTSQPNDQAYWLKVVADALHGGEGNVVASSPPNVLQPPYGREISYTLHFTSPLISLSFTRTAYCTSVTYPGWEAETKDDEGNILETVSESSGSTGASCSNPSPTAKIFYFSVPGIRSLTIRSGHFDTYGRTGPAIDDLILELL